MVVLEALESHELQKLHGALSFRRADLARDFAPDDRVREYGAPGQEIVGLEHEAAIEARSTDGAAVELDLAGAGRFETRNDAQERRLAAAGRTDQRDELAALHHEIDVLQGPQFAERFAEIEDLQLRRHLALILGPRHEPVFEPPEPGSQRDSRSCQHNHAGKEL